MCHTARGPHNVTVCWVLWTVDRRLWWLQNMADNLADNLAGNLDNLAGWLALASLWMFDIDMTAW